MWNYLGIETPIEILGVTHLGDPISKVLERRGEEIILAEEG